jgi:hypothetical protein
MGEALNAQNHSRRRGKFAVASRGKFAVASRGLCADDLG